MIFTFIFCCFFFSIFCSSIPEREPIFFNETNEINLTELIQKIKLYEGEFINIYRKASRYDELICDKIDENIIIFGRRNADILIERLNKSKEHCFKDSYEAEKFYNEYKEKNRKKKEEIIRAVNRIADINNDL